jgi:hypothetical protein
MEYCYCKELGVSVLTLQAVTYCIISDLNLSALCDYIALCVYKYREVFFRLYNNWPTAAPKLLEEFNIIHI